MAAKAEAKPQASADEGREMAGDLARAPDAAPAGRRSRAASSSSSTEFKGQSRQLYDELDKHIPEGHASTVEHAQALEKLNADIPGAPATSRSGSRTRRSRDRRCAEGDTEATAGVHRSQPAWQKQLLEQVPGRAHPMLNGLIDGKLPYEALKKLRTLVGNEISRQHDRLRRAALEVEGALRRAYRRTWRAAQGGRAEGRAAFVRANNFHRSGMKRIDDVLEPILNKGDPGGHLQGRDVRHERGRDDDRRA
jgi:hypothetical protein